MANLLKACTILDEGCWKPWIVDDSDMHMVMEPKKSFPLSVQLR